MDQREQLIAEFMRVVVALTFRYPDGLPLLEEILKDFKSDLEHEPVGIRLLH
jgi:hypothetical protein